MRLLRDSMHKEPLSGIILDPAEKHQRDRVAFFLDGVEDV